MADAIRPAATQGARVPRLVRRPLVLWDWQDWRNRTYMRALAAADIDYRKPYRSGTASPACCSRRAAACTTCPPTRARPLGDPGRYGHVYDELEDAGHVDAEEEERFVPPAGASVPVSYLAAADG